MSIIFHATILTAVAIADEWLVFFVAWVLPVIFLYHISSLLQFVCEHRWMRIKAVGESDKIHLMRLTVGRFFGEPVPTKHSLQAWGMWAAKMILHLLGRTFVIVADLPVHDWHHRHPTSREWPKALYARQRDLDAGCQGWPASYDEVWGLGNAIDAVFAFMSSLPDRANRPVAMPRDQIHKMLHGI